MSLEINNGGRFSTIHIGTQSSDLIWFLQANDGAEKLNRLEFERLLTLLMGFPMGRLTRL